MGNFELPEAINYCIPIVNKEGNGSSKQQKPAYEGAKFDNKGYCLKHPSIRLCKPSSALAVASLELLCNKNKNGTNNNNKNSNDKQQQHVKYVIIRKTCPNCGEHALWNERKLSKQSWAHGYQPPKLMERKSQDMMTGGRGRNSTGGDAPANVNSKKFTGKKNKNTHKKKTKGDSYLTASPSFSRGTVTTAPTATTPSSSPYESGFIRNSLLSSSPAKNKHTKVLHAQVTKKNIRNMPVLPFPTAAATETALVVSLATKATAAGPTAAATETALVVHRANNEKEELKELTSSFRLASFTRRSNRAGTRQSRANDTRRGSRSTDPNDIAVPSAMERDSSLSRKDHHRRRDSSLVSRRDCRRERDSSLVSRRDYHRERDSSLLSRRESHRERDSSLVSRKEYRRERDSSLVSRRDHTTTTKTRHSRQHHHRLKEQWENELNTVDGSKSMAIQMW